MASLSSSLPPPQSRSEEPTLQDLLEGPPVSVKAPEACLQCMREGLNCPGPGLRYDSHGFPLEDYGSCMCCLQRLNFVAPLPYHHATQAYKCSFAYEKRLGGRPLRLTGQDIASNGWRAIVWKAELMRALHSYIPVPKKRSAPPAHLKCSSCEPGGQCEVVKGQGRGNVPFHCKACLNRFQEVDIVLRGGLTPCNLQARLDNFLIYQGVSNAGLNLSERAEQVLQTFVDTPPDAAERNNPDSASVSSSSAAAVHYFRSPSWLNKTQEPHSHPMASFLALSDPSSSLHRPAAPFLGVNALHSVEEDNGGQEATRAVPEDTLSHAARQADLNEAFKSHGHDVVLTSSKHARTPSYLDFVGPSARPRHSERAEIGVELQADRRPQADLSQSDHASSPASPLFQPVARKRPRRSTPENSLSKHYRRERREEAVRVRSWLRDRWMI